MYYSYVKSATSTLGSFSRLFFHLRSEGDSNLIVTGLPSRRKNVGIGKNVSQMDVFSRRLYTIVNVVLFLYISSKETRGL